MVSLTHTVVVAAIVTAGVSAKSIYDDLRQPDIKTNIELNVDGVYTGEDESQHPFTATVGIIDVERK